MNVFLIGFRGCGKTEVGRGLAALLQREWIDMDAELAQRMRESIAEHVARCGWPSFRRAERSVLQELCARTGLVVSTGGGVGADSENAAAMRRSGVIVWLCASPETTLRRIEADPGSAVQRPPLRPGAERLDEIRTLLAERAPAYAAASGWRIDTDDLPVAEICRRIAAWLGSLEAGNCSTARLDKTKRFK